ncbi:ABC transporter substrate-binding protein [Sulfurimonas sp.]|nr:ABC transporter substrate-binding protein [Sulfurimonas sp.]
MTRMINITLLLLSLLLSGCGDTQQESVLKVGISPWPGYEPLVLASNKGLYQGDTHIRIIRFSTPSESFRALRDGLIDVAAFTADEVFHYAEVRSAPKIFMILDVSNGADAIVAKKNIQTIDQLKGNVLAAEGSALGHYLISRSLDFSKNTKLSDIKLTTIPINNQVQAFKAGIIDAAVTYEPSKSLLVAAGAHVLFDSSKIPNEVVDVLVTNNETLQNRSKDLKVLMDGWFKTLDYINKNYDVAMRELAEEEGTDVKNFTKAFSEIKIADRADNMSMLKKNGSLVTSMKRLSQLMYEKGSLKENINVEPILDDKILDMMED